MNTFLRYDVFNISLITLERYVQMGEFQSATPEQEPTPRQALIARLHGLVEEKLASESSVRLESSDGAVSVVGHPTSRTGKFLNLDFPVPTPRLIDEVKLASGQRFTIWDSDPNEKGPTAIRTMEVFSTEKPSGQFRLRILALKFGSALKGVVEQSVSAGTFIGPVVIDEIEQLKCQRIHKIGVRTGATQVATDEELASLKALLLESSTV